MSFRETLSSPSSPNSLRSVYPFLVGNHFQLLSVLRMHTHTHTHTPSVRLCQRAVYVSAVDFDGITICPSGHSISVWKHILIRVPPNKAPAITQTLYSFIVNCFIHFTFGIGRRAVAPLPLSTKCVCYLFGTVACGFYSTAIRSLISQFFIFPFRLSDHQRAPHLGSRYCDCTDDNNSGT